MSYPVNITNVELSKSVLADIVVTQTNNRQNAVVTFSTSACTIGSITLTPMQPTASNKEFHVNNQKLIIEKIEFHPAFGPSQGKITCHGTATDQDGNDPSDFNCIIAEWS